MPERHVPQQRWGPITSAKLELELLSEPARVGIAGVITSTVAGVGTWRALVRQKQPLKGVVQSAEQVRKLSLPTCPGGVWKADKFLAIFSASPSQGQEAELRV